MNKILIILLGLIICSCETIRNDKCFNNCNYMNSYCEKYKIKDCQLKLQSCYNECFEEVEQDNSKVIKAEKN